MKLILGSELPAHVQAEIKRLWIYRNTLENQRAHPAITPKVGANPAMIISDAAWLNTYYFAITDTGSLDQRFPYCVHPSTTAINQP